MAHQRACRVLRKLVRLCRRADIGDRDGLLKVAVRRVVQEEHARRDLGRVVDGLVRVDQTAALLHHRVQKSSLLRVIRSDFDRSSSRSQNVAQPQRVRLAFCLVCAEVESRNAGSRRCRHGRTGLDRKLPKVERPRGEHGAADGAYPRTSGHVPEGRDGAEVVHEAAVRGVRYADEFLTREVQGDVRAAGDGLLQRQAINSPQCRGTDVLSRREVEN